MTCSGFWLVFALSRYTSGLPCTSSRRMGKSARTRSTSKARAFDTPGLEPGPAGWTASGSVLVIGKVPVQLREQLALELLPQMIDGNTRQHFAGVRVNQHVARVALGEPARAQVEHRLFVELPDRRPVRALHIVG